MLLLEVVEEIEAGAAGYTSKMRVTATSKKVGNNELHRKEVKVVLIMEVLETQKD